MNVSRFACVTVFAAALTCQAFAAEPTAHDPQYDSDAWKGYDRRAAFFKQEWPEARVLVWAHVGKQLEKGDPGPDPKKASNWLEDGKPAQSVPDADTDVVVPAAKAPYAVKGKGRPEASVHPYSARRNFVLRCRHLTVGANAELTADRMEVYGNLWVKDGARIFAKTLHFGGRKHAFMRCAEGHPCHYFSADRLDGSIEFLSDFKCGDEFRVSGGTLICAPDTRVRPGRNSSQSVGKNAKLVLLDGARFGKWENQIGDSDVLLRGTLQAGTPNRPLARDCYLELSCKDHERHLETKPNRGFGMLVYPGAKIEVHTKDPAKARLVIKWNENKPHHLHRMSKADQAAWPEIAKKIDIKILEDVVLEGVLFDQFRKGGILLKNPAIRDQWKHVYFGEQNAGAPDELFAPAGK